MTANQLLTGCPICQKPLGPQSDFCVLHSNAMKKLDDAFETWRVALDQDLSKHEYFERLLRLTETGRAVRQVIEYREQKVRSGI